MIELIQTALESINWSYVTLSRLRYKNSYLPIRYGDPHWLERPFAYEIYHQLRCRCEKREEFDCVIQGEVFKHYQEIRELKRMPDLLIHKPDSNEKNLAVVEIKLASNPQKSVEADFNKLAMFRRILKYQRLIEIIIGTDSEIESLRRQIDEMTQRDGTEIVILYLSIENHKVQQQLLNWREITAAKKSASQQAKIQLRRPSRAFD
jgi:hypothetical protein